MCLCGTNDGLEVSNEESSSSSWLLVVVAIVAVLLCIGRDYHDVATNILTNFIGPSIFVTAFTTTSNTRSFSSLLASSSIVWKKKGQSTNLLSKNSKDDGEEIEEYSDFDGFIGDASDTSFSVGSSGSGSDDDFKLPDFDIDDNKDNDDTIITAKDGLDDSSSSSSSSGSTSMEEQIATIMYQSNKIDDTSRSQDLSGIRVRQFSLGQDFVLSNYVGSAGFEEVTDWEYYYQDEDDDSSSKSGKSSTSRRQVVQPNLFDKSQPKRTRTSSGSVVRIFFLCYSVILKNFDGGKEKKERRK